jgi:hypothetical protein
MRKFMGFFMRRKYANIDPAKQNIWSSDDFLAPGEFNAALTGQATLHAGRQPNATGTLLCQNIVRHPAGKQARP